MQKAFALFHRARRFAVLPLLLAAILFLDVPGPAAAFSLFGIHLFGEDKEAEEDAVSDPVRYTVQLTVVPEVKGLQDTLESASSLVADKEKPVSGSLGLLAKAKNDRKRLVAALYENARYDGLVTIRIQGRDIADLAPDASFDTSGPVPVEITVVPGQLFTLGAVRATANGVPLDADKYGLTPGSSADSVRILDAEGKLLKALRDEGRPFVAVTKRDIIADSATARLDYAIAISPGEPVPFGTTYVDGTKRMVPGFVAYMAGIRPGTLYSVAELDKARQRLVKLGVFSSATVKAADAQGPNGALPVQIEVAERPLHIFGVGATFSNTDGAGVNGYWEHRNLFGRAESLRIEGAVSRIGANSISDTGRETDGFDYTLSAVFRKPGVLGPDSVYIGSITALTEQPLAYDRQSIAVSNGVEYELDERQTVAAAFRAEYETITDYTGDEEYLIGSLPLSYTFDGRDDALNPTEGLFAKLYAEPSYDVEDSTPFFKARAEASSYLSLTESNRFIVAGRLAYGTIFGADLEDVPNDRRFYAGGGGSVRGYVFQSIGPYFPSDSAPGTNEEFEDTPTGGLSLFEASAELRIGVTENIQIVPFIDGGTVGDDLVPDFSEFKLGAGVGARYLTGFGPIRIDVGVPLDPGPRDGSFQIYAGIGQAF